MTCIKLPFQFVNGKLDTSDSVDVSARQKIIDTLITDRFERVMRHNYGVGIRSLLYEPVDSLAFADFKVDALQTLSESVSRVEVLDIQLISLPANQYYGEEETTVSINVVYRLPLGAPRVFSFNAVVPGYITEDTPI